METLDPMNVLLGVGVYFVIKYLFKKRKERTEPATDGTPDVPPPMVADHEPVDEMPDGPYRDTTD